MINGVIMWDKKVFNFQQTPRFSYPNNENNLQLYIASVPYELSLPSPAKQLEIRFPKKEAGVNLKD